MTDADNGPHRREVNLRSLPSWVQYVIALATVAVVVGLAWRAGGDEPVPRWASEILVPALAWVFILSLVGALLVRVVRRRGRGG